jgi:hypothetical protein
VTVRIGKNIAGLRGTTTGCDAIRSADVLPNRPMLDHRPEGLFLRLLMQENTNSDLIPEEPDGMVDKEDIPTLDSWTEWVAEDLWVLGDEVEQSVPVELKFAQWDEQDFTDPEYIPESYHG